MKKADYLHRFIAKAIDFLLVGVPASISWVGVLAGALYLVISDGFFSGQSVGKKLIGLQVRSKSPDGNSHQASFRESILRNLAFGIILILASIPILNWIFFPLGLIFVAVEAYFVYVDDSGIRIGDIFASTQVAEFGNPEK